MLPTWPRFEIIRAPHLTVQVSAAIAEHEAFLDNGLAAQRKQAKHQPLAITPSAIIDRKGTLERACNPIVNKPKPLPEVKKEQPPATVEPEASTPADAPKAEQPTGGELD